MTTTVTFEQVEQLAAQLPPPEQLKLVACLSEQLSGLLKANFSFNTESMQRTREMMADKLLADLDGIAESIAGQFDSAEDIRNIRAERASQI
jgi:hypothetical protein